MLQNHVEKKGKKCKFVRQDWGLILLYPPGDQVRGVRMVLETQLGQKMDDLLTSYISLMLTNANKKSPPLK